MSTMLRIDFINEFFTLPYIFSFITVLISVYSIWLSQLRGATIGIFERPKIELLDLSEKDFMEGHIPLLLPIKNLDLFFINSGNRTGILKDVQIVYLDKNVNLYLKVSSDFKIQYGDTDRNFLLISDRSANNILITNLSLQVNSDINKGKEFKEFDLIKKSDKLEEIINAIFDKQRKNLEQFIKFIDESYIFGKMEVSYNYTGRKYWLVERIKSQRLDLNIENNYIQAVEGYRKLLTSWDNLQPTTENVILDLIEFLNKYKEKIKRNRNVVSTTGVQHLEYTLNDFSEFEHSFQCNLLKKWELSIEVFSKLDILKEKMKDYKKKYDMALADSNFTKDLEKYKEELIPQHDTVISQIDKLKADLMSILNGYQSHR